MSLYTRLGLKRNFQSVRIFGDTEQYDKALLIISNHFSWWDGFFIYYLNDRVFKKRFHVMMLEDQLKRNMILNKVGAFSVQKNSRSILESLKYARQILDADPGNMLLFYPQGEIQSLYTRPLHFEKGIESVMKGVSDKVDICFVVCLVDYFSFKKPGLSLHLKKFNPPNPFSVNDLERGFNEYMEEAIATQHPES